MTNHPINVGDQATVKDGRYKGRLVEVLELKNDNTSARCQFVPSGLNEKEIRMQDQGQDFAETWLGVDILEPVTPGKTSETGIREQQA